MAWIELLIASFFEVLWATSLKYSANFTKLIPSAITVIGLIASFLFLEMATRELPIGTAYAVWTGIGAVGTVVLGIALFHEPAGIWRMLFLSMVIVGIMGLKATAS